MQGQPRPFHSLSTAFFLVVCVCVRERSVCSVCVFCAAACLAKALFSSKKIYKIFQIFRHIKSLDAYMKYEI